MQSPHIPKNPFTIYWKLVDSLCKLIAYNVDDHEHLIKELVKAIHLLRKEIDI